MSGKSRKYELQHEQAIQALLRTTTLQAAARQMGLNERTLRRWWELPEFQTKYRVARRELINGTVHMLLQATGSATDTLVSIMNDAEQPATARVSAARTILTLVMNSVKDDDVEARLREVEQLLVDLTHRGPHGQRPTAA